ncbi:hypothetical protein ILUMI_02377 [Ignelater luminosus]|uniref:Uncharacterized protein n=1 Tax=Ignelater luminosus TaxID=2038154 RepID=A0A8K0DCP2_IGNLU|nr:hypothetical protein ILUMI_02377 [Ignelater luminosus]
MKGFDKANTNSDQIEDKDSNNRRNCFRNAKSYFIEFCNNTSIHGFKFLGETNRSILEKIWWFVVISLSLCGCISLITQTYHKWVASPVIVSFATSQTPISDIPFPAITICSDIKSSGRLFKFGNVHQKIKHGIEITKEELSLRFKQK